MNENDMSQQERDAAEVERMRIGLSTFGAFAPEYYRAAIHTIDRLRAENERLRAAITLAARHLDAYENAEARLLSATADEHLNDAIAVIRTALKSEDAKAAALAAADAATPADGNGNEVAE